LNQIDKKYSKQCWRGCQEIGTYIHMWWSCKYVQKFWENVFKEIKGITKTEIIGTAVPIDLLTLVCFRTARLAGAGANSRHSFCSRDLNLGPFSLQLSALTHFTTGAPLFTSKKPI
uniref:Uncharacterized protein n=1 Tax=Anolis carolinensis TaxID=28377 RepID=A0A803T7G6_ANOCA